MGIEIRPFTSSAAALSFSEVKTDHGFDDAIPYKWQMVPRFGRRQLIVYGAGDREPVVRDRHLVNVVQKPFGSNKHIVSLYGNRAGRTRISWQPASEARNWSPETGQYLDVAVKDLRRVDVAFHYVDAGPKLTTSRSRASLNLLVARVNNILQPQSNVRINVVNAQNLVIGRSKDEHYSIDGDYESKEGMQKTYQSLLKHADTNADMNVFFLKELDFDINITLRIMNSNLETDVEGVGMWEIKTLLLEDNLSGPDHIVLAHEIVHTLGKDGHLDSPCRSVLMSPSSVFAGRTIGKDIIDTINP